MRRATSLTNLWIPCLLLSLLMASSSSPQAPDAPPSLPSGPELAHQQEMLVFAFVSYAGELLTGDDDEVEKKLAPCVEAELERQPLLAGNWDLVWGPAVYKFAHAKLDDNMLYVARGRDDTSHLVVATRGTNGKAILDWFAEDLDVVSQVAWAYGDPPSNLDPKISQATHKGVKILQEMKPAGGLPGDGQTLREFLARQVRDAGVTRVDVTGHSLGGALAPTLTLWLADTRGAWDPDGKVTLSATAFAGATPGNADFATYYDERVGDATYRVHNPYDLVPMAFALSTIKEVSSLYEPDIRTPKELKVLADVLLVVLKDAHYAQIRPDAPPFPGKIEPGEDKFLAQAGWQHTCGYLDGLKIRGRFKPVASECAGPDSDPEVGWPTCLGKKD